VPVLGITGGIATGKSMFVQALLRQLPAAHFDADRCAGELLAGDDATRSAVREAFGDDVFDVSGSPDRARLRVIVFGDEAKRRRLEAILHPAIRQRWTAQAAQHRAPGAWLVVDIPLLFETGAESHFDRIAVVACSLATQRRRLSEQRGLDPAISEKIIGAQLPLSAKVDKADHVIWNDSTVACLDGQAGFLAAFLQRHYV
jgi:dephospho-CoA kinase